MTGSEAGKTGAERALGSEAAHGPDDESPPVSERPRRPWWKVQGGKLWATVAGIVIAAVAALLGSWLTFFAGPPAAVLPTAAPSGNASHPPSRHDISTMTPGQRFSTVPNFYYDPVCGRPCFVPLYQLPVQRPGTYVTQGWPCEYYDPYANSSAPSCLQPPPGRTPTEMENSGARSGDRVLVICQVMSFDHGQQAETIHNDTGQGSNIWDVVALPKAHVFGSSSVTGSLRTVPGMPGFYEAYGPDMWLGDSGWHSIPCN